MKRGRLHALSDGIFSIAATLLVLELRVPTINQAGNHALWLALKGESVTFLSYLMSFMALYIYWRAHTFIMSLVDENLTVWLSNLNALFLLFVALVPFSAEILGRFHRTSLAISIYALNIIFIGLLLFAIRYYIEYSGKINHLEVSPQARHNGYIRILTPVAISVISVPLSIVSPSLALALLLLVIGFNFLPNHSRLARWILKVT